MGLTKVKHIILVCISVLPYASTLTDHLGPLRQRRSRQIISHNTISIVAHISWSFCWYS
jgi:hypothetical protein